MFRPESAWGAGPPQPGILSSMDAEVRVGDGANADGRIAVPFGAEDGQGEVCQRVDSKAGRVVSSTIQCQTRDGD